MSLQNPGGPPCLSSRASETSRGISNPEPLPSCGKGTCLGADHTKEFLSFEKQPSPFKGRNQSWFHPLRTPSRPGAAAPGPHGGLGAVVGAFACHLPAAMHRPPAARFRDSFVIVSLFESRARPFLPRRQRFRVGDPSNRPAGSVGMTVRVSRRDSRVRQRWQDGRDTIKSRGRGVLPDLSSRASRASRGISMLDALPPWWKNPRPALKKSYDAKRVSHHRAAGGRCSAAGRWYAEKPTVDRCPRGVQGPRPLVGKGFSKGETTIGFAL